MSEGKESGFRFYSFGIVAVTKDRNTSLIKVVPIEDITLATGRSESTNITSSGNSKPNVKSNEAKSTAPISKQTMSYNVEVKDHKGVSRSDGVTGDLMVVAKWTAFGQSNRITAPDVQHGETVMLFQAFDTDEYFWTSMMNEPSIRRQETVCYIFGNIPSGSVPWDKSTSYWVEVSTHDKHVKLHTSKNDGEAVGYDFTIDTDKGTFTIADTAGNEVVLDSVAGSLNATLISSVTIKAPKTKVDGDFEVTGSSVLTGGVSMGANLSVSAGLAAGAGTGGGDVTIGGNVSMTGNIALQGNIQGNGSINISGPINASNHP